MNNTQLIGQTVRSVGQSRNARWMRWQDNRWTSAAMQMVAMSPAIERSRSTHATWRNGVIPDGDTILRLVDAYPSLKAVFWPEQVTSEARRIADELDALEAAISKIREAL